MLINYCDDIIKGTILGPMKSLFGAIAGPKYNGKYLRQKLSTLLGDIKLHQTLTNILITAFDIKILQPTIFSTHDPLKTPLMSDVCISKSTAPTYLPSHFFDTEILKENPDFYPIKAMECTKFLILSLGTGSAKVEEKFTAALAAKWGNLSWLYNNGSTPLIDSFFHASFNVVDIHISVLYQALKCEKNYLRIQDDSLTGDTTSIDISTKIKPEIDFDLASPNSSLEARLARLLKKLVRKKLLNQTVSRSNLETGKFDEIKGEGTNQDALIRFTKLMSNERRLQHGQKLH
ncbi:hypothetical protein MKX01_005868 [Papaver californicum]|nr:hypothetical protein MKX01_005868 [Papaver californicum]